MKSKIPNKFLIILSLLIVSEIISLSVGYNSQYSVDVRGWWPFELFFTTVIFFIYGILFISIDEINPTSQTYTFLINLILACILTIHGILFYTAQINWLFCRIGSLSLSMDRYVDENTF